MSFDDHPINVLNRAGPPKFVETDAQVILDQQIAHFEAETGRTLSPSQVEMYSLETQSYMLSLRGAEEQRAFESNLVAYADGASLDEIGPDRNTPRLLAQSSTTVLRFVLDAPAVTRIKIPKGTRVGDVNEVVQFQTTADATLEVGEVTKDIAAGALKKGISANGFAVGAIASLIDTVPGITSVQNIFETGGGANIEPNNRYRVRIALANEKISRGGGRQTYRALVFDFNARINDVAIIQPQRGYDDIYPLVDTGGLTELEKTQLLKSLEGKVPQGDIITIRDPIDHGFDVTLELVVSSSSAVEPARVAVQAVLDKWRLSLGGYIAPSELTSAAKSIENVINAKTPDLALVEVPENAWRNAGVLTVTVEVR